MKRMNKMLLVAALAATTLSVQAEQKKGPAWLSDALFYQIYPSSYMDTDGNGIGDLPGITSKLDYIKSLGVNALWLNPIFESGWFDGGYDVIDFYKVDPRFGTNTDLVTLVNEAHKRGIKVCLDLVAGHSSTKCAWFKESSEKDPDTGEEEEILIENTETRDQPKNRAKALLLLKSQLYDRAMKKRLEAKAKIEAGKKKIEWGSQIRSYVFDDRRVKDHRTNYQTSDVDGVMDGKIDDFIKAYLMEFPTTDDEQ